MEAKMQVELDYSDILFMVKKLVGDNFFIKSDIESIVLKNPIANSLESQVIIVNLQNVKSKDQNG